MIQYRTIPAGELSPALFASFVRHQTVTRCWRREQGAWVIRDAPLIDDWTPEDYRTLVQCLKNTVNTGGFVYGAFSDGLLKGFVSVEPTLFGGEQGYLDLSSIHVSEEMRGAGTGRTLFRAAADWARAKGARKLYISAHSAAETQAFYRNLGCTDAQECDRRHMEAEPFDCQLEYEL